MKWPTISASRETPSIGGSRVELYPHIGSVGFGNSCSPKSMLGCEAVALQMKMSGAVPANLALEPGGARMSGVRDRRLVSLFTGAGGLDLGLEAAGFNPALCVEIDEDARQTLAKESTRLVLSLIRATFTHSNPTISLNKRR